MVVHRRRFSKFAIASVVLVVTVFVAQAAIARISSPATSIKAKGSLISTKAVRSNDAFTDSSSSWDAVTGMSTTVTIPSGKAIVLVWFTAESTSYDGADSGGWTSVRVRVGGKIGEPNEGTNFAWQSATSAAPYEALAMSRSAGPLGAGTYTVRMEVDPNGWSMWVDDMSMIVQVVQV